MSTNDPATSSDSAHAPDVPATRWAVLAELEAWLEKPMMFLGFVWLALLVIDLTRGLSGFLAVAATAIWIVFIVDFALRLWLAPRRFAYLRHNWLTALSLVVPALRVFRVLALARLASAARTARAFQGVTRGARLVRVIGSINRGMAALRRSMKRRGLGFVLLLTAVVLLAGAAGMYAFEHDATTTGGIDSFGAALWWTAMLMTTMGSDYWPRSPEGRALCLALAVYAFAVFGYVTASLASFFVGRDAAAPDAELPGAEAFEALRAEIAALRGELRAAAAARGETPPPFPGA